MGRIFTSLIIVIGILIIPNTVQAKQISKVNLHLQNKKVVVKKPKILKKAKKVKLTVKKKSVVKAALQKKKKQLTFKAKKKGCTKVVLKCKMKNNKRKTLNYNVKVKSSKIDKVVKGFIGEITVKSCSVLCVGLEWTKQNEDVMFYKVERKTIDSEWKSIGSTQKTSMRDYDIKEKEVYFYRVVTRLSDEWMEPSEPVMVVVEEPETEEPIQTSDRPVNTPISSEETIETPTPVPTPTPYVARYSYEVVDVLNCFNIYEDVPIVLYIKTDNPNPNDSFEEYGGVYVSVIGDSGIDYDYGDVKYLEQEQTNHTMFNKVEGGWTTTVMFQNSGLNTVKIAELDSSGEENEWRIVDTFQIEVKDGVAAEEEYCNKVLEEITNDEYNADGRGKWSELDDYNKVKRIEEYIIKNYTYPRSNDGYPIWYIQENVGVFWETGYADCGAANYLLRRLAGKLGFETEINQGTINGRFHITALVTINGEKMLFDAQPGKKVYKEWDYIM